MAPLKGRDASCATLSVLVGSPLGAHAAHRVACYVSTGKNARTTLLHIQLPNALQGEPPVQHIAAIKQAVTKACVPMCGPSWSQSGCSWCTR